MMHWIGTQRANGALVALVHDKPSHNHPATSGGHELLRRIATALVLIPAVILLIFWLPPRAFRYLSLGIMAWAAWEWAQLFGWKTIWMRLGYVLVFLVLAMVLYAGPRYLLLNVALLGWGLTWIWLYAYQCEFITKTPFAWWRASMNLWVSLGAWLGLVTIRESALGIYGLYWLLSVVWLVDTGAYFVGKRWGRRRLASRISPKKSWEGVMAGVATAFVLGVLFSLWQFYPNHFLQSWLGVGLAMSLVACFVVGGDLWESACKRFAGVKDSGSLFPGHGGLLDRIDGLMAAAPLFAWWLLQVLRLR